MRQALQRALVDREEQEDEVQSSPALLQLLDEAERATVPRPEPPRQPARAPARAPRPFAYD